MARAVRLVGIVAFGLGAISCAAANVGADDGVGESESESASSSEGSGDSTSSTSTSSAETGSSSSSTSSSSTDTEASETSEPLTVEVSTLAYGDDPAQVLDLYLPVPAPIDPLPTLVLAHGGLWQSGDRSALANLCEQIVLGSGGTQACASIEYRLSQDLGGTCMAGPDTYRSQLQDLADAFVLLQNQAALHGIDPTRMFVGGHSAGGHLAHALNLRWAEFEGVCTRGGGCPRAIGAVGIEGIYDLAAWDSYDQAFWNGSFACATRKAFGDPLSCVDAQLGLPCWDAGSPTYLATHAGELGIVSTGNALMIHSPGDNWVDIAEASGLGAALESAFPASSVIVAIDGTCAAGGHNELLDEAALATCLVNFVASGGAAI